MLEKKKCFCSFHAASTSTAKAISEKLWFILFGPYLPAKRKFRLCHFYALLYYSGRAVTAFKKFVPKHSVFCFQIHSFEYTSKMELENKYLDF